MSDKDKKVLIKNPKLITITFLIVAGLVGFAWWKNQQAEELKLKLQRERIGEAFRQAGLASAKIQQSQNTQTIEDNESAPDQFSADAELVQAKLWHTLPKDKREILRAETIRAGLEAARKEQLPDLPPITLPVFIEKSPFKNHVACLSLCA